MRVPAANQLGRLAAGVLCLAATAPAAAQSAAGAEQARYESCLALVDRDANEAFEQAQTWRMQGGGWPAGHCEARSLVALGDEINGARQIERIANSLDGPDDTGRPIMLAEAGRAWLDAGRPDDAKRAFEAGLVADHQRVELWSGLAQAEHERRDWDGLADAAAELIALAPERSDGWRMRGRARFERGDINGAAADMEQARLRDPGDIQALLLRGDINEARRVGRSPSGG